MAITPVAANSVCVKKRQICTGLGMKSDGERVERGPQWDVASTLPVTAATAYGTEDQSRCKQVLAGDFEKPFHAASFTAS
jgi:hypothetical protein